MYCDEVGDIIKMQIKKLSIQGKLNDKRIFLFGYNIYTEHINNFLYGEGYRLCNILDNDKKKQGRKVANIIICAPESIDWKDDSVVLIASKHYKDMKNQIQEISNKIDIFKLFDFVKYLKKAERKDKFWLQNNFDNEIKKIYHGAAIYNKIKNEEMLIVFPTPSIGDIFIGCLCICEYEKEKNKKNIKIVVCSKGVYSVTQMFAMNNVEMIFQKEMEDLVKFMYYDGKEDFICSWRVALVSMATYKQISFSQFWAKYFFEIENDYQMHFPSIWDKMLKEEGLKKQGLIKDKTIILAPYANSVEELPVQFWELLVEKLLKMDYMVVTNIVGHQKAIRKSIGLEIPLNQIGTYMEYCGCFISLRSGLCDVAGRSRCKQIVIFRDRKPSWHSSDIEFFDLHSENISKNAIYCLYIEDDFLKSIQMVIDSLRIE